jgi:WD40 repeat protein/DNA-binding SARP family transcriptional activator
VAEELRVTLFGSPSVCLGGELVTGFVSSKAQALVYYLAATRRDHTRESLAGLLWSELPDAAARRNLRNALSNLRKLIGPYLCITRHTAALNQDSGYAVDSLHFVELLSSVPRDASPGSEDLDPLHAAVELYQGEFLAGFYVPKAPLFEEWALRERERLRLALEGVLERLVQGHIARGEYKRAIGFAQRWLAADPLREAAHRALMELYAWSGDRSAAVRQYEACAQVLKEELGVEPSPETAELHIRICAGELRPGVAERREPVIRGYEIRERIGAGSFAVVYRAYQPHVGREVAIKAILPQYANQPDFIRRFEAESQLVARLEHPHIVPLYDYWREPGGAYLVMRWLRGGSLRAALQRGPWKVEAATRLVDQIATALAAAHRQGVVHRDIKPANILLDEEDNAYLSDFGIAKDMLRRPELTQTGALAGSPAYISPEQIQEQPVTPLSDIYSLGVVLYELLTGVHPFPDEPLATLLVKHLHEPLPAVTVLRPELPPAVDEVIQRATAKDPAQRFPDVLNLANTFRQALTVKADIVEPVVAIPAAEAANPYKGLRPFYEADAADFFGREALIQQLLDRLAEADGMPHFLAVVGPSGSGKSSVVRAGLIPALRQGALPGSENWYVIQMLPGAQPLEELEAALLRIAVNPPESLLRQMREGEHGLLRAIKRVLPAADASPDQSELLLLIDQFEEVFILVEDESERVRFLEGLLAAATDPRGRLRVIVTLRADFYDRPLEYAGLGELMRQHTEVVLPLSSAELERAIAGPAERVGVELEPGLLAEIVADVTDQPGALPLLQYALTELFERRTGNLLTQEAYHALGGVLGALGQRAEELYQGLDAGGQEAARQLFLRLVTLGEGMEDTRRRVLRAELTSLQPSAASAERVHITPVVLDQVIDLYGRYRLLTFDRDPLTRGPTVEVAHEALLRGWGRLQKWLDANREDLRAHRRLTAAAAEWLDANQDDGFLLRGSRLNQFDLWARETDLALTQAERDYLQASLALQQQREARREKERAVRALAAERMRQAEIERQRAEEQARTSRYLRWLAWGLAAVLIVAIAATVFALIQRSESQQLLRQSISHRLTAAAINSLERYPERSVLLALEAVSATYGADKTVTREANMALRRALQALRVQHTLFGHGGPVYDIAFSPDGTCLATASADRTARVWDSASGQEVFTTSGHRSLVRSVAFSPPEGVAGRCGALLATASEDGTVKVWSLAPSPAPSTKSFQDTLRAGVSGEELLTLSDPAGPVLSVVFDPDGTRLATASQDGTVRVWRAATGQELLALSGHMGPVQGIAFSPDGMRLATGGEDGAVKVWSLSSTEDLSGAELLALSGHAGPVYAVAFSLDGTRLATAGADGTARVWDATSGEELLTLSGHSGAVRDVAFSPDGTRLATTGADEKVKFWSLGSSAAPSAGSSQDTLRASAAGQELLTLSGHTGPVHGVAFSPDGTRLATASEDRTGRVWEVSVDQELPALFGHVGTVWDAAFSPDGTRLATAGEDRTARVWSLASGADPSVDIRTGALGQELLTLSGHNQDVNFVAFSPDGTRLATASYDGTAKVWSLASSSAVPGEELLTLSGHTGWVMCVAFSPDGTRLATTSADGTARVWDAASGDELLTLPGHTGLVYAVAFSPDGTRLATTSYDGTARVWDTASGRELLTLSGHTGWLFGIAFSPDGTRLATAGEDGTGRVWDAASGQELLTLSGHTDWALDIAFGPDGRRLATASADGTVRVWDATSGEEMLTLPGETDLVDGVAFSPDGACLVMAGAGGMVRIVVLDMEELMAQACSRVTRNLTEAEWEAYLGRDLPYRRTCPDLPVPPAWLTYGHLD